MDPLTLGIGAISLGMQFFGGAKAAEASSQSAQASQRIAGLEQDVNAQRKTAMELSSRRQQMEIFRNNQRARAMASNAAVNQGAQFGSGIQGGLAQVQDESMTNYLGVSKNLEIGNNIFGINDKISQQKSLISGLQSDAATYNGISSMGGSLMGANKAMTSLYGYATAPSGQITLGGPMGPTPFSPQYT